MKQKRNKKLTKEQLNQKVLYFAYGSNMHKPRLEERVGEVKFVATYQLPGYKLTFDAGNSGCTYANVKDSVGETCEGVIYEMTYRQLLILDSYEGLYERFKVMYGERRLHVYISERMRNERIVPHLTMEYYALLMLGCMEHCLNKSQAIVEKLKPTTTRRFTLEHTYFRIEEEWV